MPTWINQFEKDTYRFAAFLKNQILIIKLNIQRLERQQISSFQEKVLKPILSEQIQNNYVLIRRHYILFSLFTELTLEFASYNYSSIQKMRAVFQHEKLQKINGLINKGHRELISDFKSSDFSQISGGNVVRIEERIKCMSEEINSL